MHPQAKQFRFECTGCGACCVGAADHVVEVSRAEQDALQDFLKLDRRHFRRRYLQRLEDGEFGVRLGRDGRCPFLQDNGRCGVYPVRPRQCRTYPWWPELLRSRQAWETEAKRCEGIGRGQVIAREEISLVLMGLRDQPGTKT